MEREAEGDDLNGGLETEYSNEVGLCVILERNRETMRRAIFVLEVIEWLMKRSGKESGGVGWGGGVKAKDRKKDGSFFTPRTSVKRSTGSGALFFG